MYVYVIIKIYKREICILESEIEWDRANTVAVHWLDGKIYTTTNYNTTNTFELMNNFDFLLPHTHTPTLHVGHYLLDRLKNKFTN